jgi:hypothetical protein
MSNLLQRLKERWKDKKLTEKCGLSVREICVHELELIIYPRPNTTKMWQCVKCGGFYR